MLLCIQVFEGFPDADNNDTENHIPVCPEEEKVKVKVDFSINACTFDHC